MYFLYSSITTLSHFNHKLCEYCHLLDISAVWFLYQATILNAPSSEWQPNPLRFSRSSQLLGLQFQVMMSKLMPHHEASLASKIHLWKGTQYDWLKGDKTTRYSHLVDAPGLDKPAVLFTLLQLSEEECRKIGAKRLAILGLCEASNTSDFDNRRLVKQCMLMPAWAFVVLRM